MSTQQPMPSPRARRVWTSIVAVLLIAGVFAVSGYTSYAVYGIVRTSVAHSISLPSFEMVSRQNQEELATQVASTVQPAGEVGGQGTQPTVSVQPTLAPPDDRINILLLGIDQRPGETGPFRTDTMIVLTIDPKAGTVGMLSIPRDLWVPIPGYEENRINTAHFFGDLKKYPGGGVALAKKTVSYNFGFPVHYYVRVNFEGFKQIIDTIGGVDIDVPFEINDSLYPDDNYGYEPLYIPAGRVHMDGSLALKYARTRKTDNDFHRAHRQQQVILAIKDKVLTLNLLPSLLPKLPELMRTLSDTVQTDMPLDEMIRLANLARTMDTSTIKSVVIDDSMTVSQTTPSGAAVLLPIRESIRPVVDDLFWSPLPTVAPAQ